MRRRRISRPSVAGSTMSALCKVDSRAKAFSGDSHLRLIRRRLDVGRKQLQLFGLALLVEHLDGFATF
jgi:hypothetical protein